MQHHWSLLEPHASSQTDSTVNTAPFLLETRLRAEKLLQRAETRALRTRSLHPLRDERMCSSKEHWSLLELHAFSLTDSTVNTAPFLLETRLRAEKLLRRTETASFSAAWPKHLWGGAGEGSSKVQSCHKTCCQSDFNTKSRSNSVNAALLIEAALIAL